MAKKLPPQAKTANSMAYVKPARIDLDPKQAKAWEMTRAKLLWTCPAFSHVFITMMATGKYMAVFTRDVPIAATDGKSLFLNPDTFFNYNLDQRVFICVHEIMHCIWLHCALMWGFIRRGKVKYADGSELPYISELMNVAADYVINDLLIEAQVGEFNKDWLHDKSIANSKDEVLEAYKKLFEHCKKNGQIIGVSFDQHLAPGSGNGQDPTEAADQRQAAEGQWKQEVAAGMAAAKAMGKLPAGLERVLGEILNPKVDWRDHIRSEMARNLGEPARNFRRPNRHLIVRDIYAPGKTKFGTGVVVVGNDTSGSIDYGPGSTGDMFLSEIAGILEDCRPEKLYIMWCDAHVHRVDECDDVGDLMAIRELGAPGGGGTSFVPVFQKIEELGIVPEALIYLTDGMGTFPGEAPKYPVIWGNITPEYKYPFGTVVDVPKQVPGE